MNVLVILIPVSIILGALGLAAFLWTVRNGQYEDEAGTAARILLDDETSPTASTEPESTPLDR